MSSNSGKAPGASGGGEPAAAATLLRRVKGTEEDTRLRESREHQVDWKLWGPYVSERAWGTVREDYSANGDAWGFFSFDDAHKRAFRWSEDGLAGFCNRFQNLVLSLALWNGRDPILKERLFGLANPEGNHGEDVKEYYFYVDATPTHSWNVMKYRYPMDAFPYDALREQNAKRSRMEPEFELWEAYGPDKWQAGRYWDVTVSYAKASANELLCRIEATNCSAEAATLHILPQFIFRNTWSWGYDPHKPIVLPRKYAGSSAAGAPAADSPSGGDATLQALAYERHLGNMRYAVHVPSSEGTALQKPLEMLVTNNETNFMRLYGSSNEAPGCHTKDAFHTHVAGDNADGEPGSVGTILPPGEPGTKAATWCVLDVQAGATGEVWVRFSCDGSVLTDESRFDSEQGSPMSTRHATESNASTGSFFGMIRLPSIPEDMDSPSQVAAVKAEVPTPVDVTSRPTSTRAADTGRIGGGGPSHENLQRTADAAETHADSGVVGSAPLRGVQSLSTLYAAASGFMPAPGASGAPAGSGGTAVAQPSASSGAGGGAHPPAAAGAALQPRRPMSAIDLAALTIKIACMDPEHDAGASSARSVTSSALSCLLPPLQFDDFMTVLEDRKAEADAFYAALHSRGSGVEERNIQRQALAGLLWSKQYYHYGVDMWLDGDPAFKHTAPPPQERLGGRNHLWRNLYANEVLSMPDKWEYPWWATWDLAFHMVPMAMVDPDFAKYQLLLLMREWYMHPSGAIPSYEYNFDDLNPPVHAWACYRVYQISRKVTGVADVVFLERAFHKLMLNFSWWANRKDRYGRNLFEGGFLGLDNIGAFDRSQIGVAGAHLEQADATAWMSAYCVDMLCIALELSQHSIAYEDVASKFFEHFMTIAHSIYGDSVSGQPGLWHEEDGFFYDHLRTGGGRVPVKAKSFVGLIPLFACMTIDERLLDKLPSFKARMSWFLSHRKHLIARHSTLISEPKVIGSQPLASPSVTPITVSVMMSGSQAAPGGTRTVPATPAAVDGVNAMQVRVGCSATVAGVPIAEPMPASSEQHGCRLLSLVAEEHLPRILERMLSEAEFLSPFGLRSLSKEHETAPLEFNYAGLESTLKYEPGESSSGMYGGNSSWRGPVWFPTCYMMIERLQVLASYFGDDLLVEFPTGSGEKMNLWQVSHQLAERLLNLFRANAETKTRPVHGANTFFSTDERWKDLIWFYEYFDGDTGRGCGASHQTGWTALVAKLIQHLGDSKMRAAAAAPAATIPTLFPTAASSALLVGGAPVPSLVAGSLQRADAALAPILGSGSLLPTISSPELTLPPVTKAAAGTEGLRVTSATSMQPKPAA